MSEQVVELVDAGKYVDAFNPATRALNLALQHLAENHPLYLVTLNNIAQLYFNTGNYAEAEPIYNKILNLCGEDDEERCSYLVAGLGNRAQLYWQLGRFEEAEADFLKAMRLSLEHKSAQLHYPVILDNLAGLYLATGRYDEAEPLYTKALASWRLAYKEDHPDTLKSMSGLSELYRAMGNYAEAAKLQTQVLKALYKKYGKYHPDVARSLNNLALIYSDSGSYEEAEPLFRHSLDIRIQTLGAEHPDTSIAMNNLAYLCQSMNRYDEAAPLYRRALALRGRAYGQDHPVFATALNNLGLLLYGTGDYETAETLWKRSLEIWLASYGEGHPSISRGLTNLGQLYIATDRADEGMSLLTQSALIGDRFIGQIFSIGSESDYMAYLRTLQTEFDSYLSALLQFFPDDNKAVRTGFELVLRRKAIVAEALAVQREMVLSGRYPDLAPMLKEMLALRVQIARRTLAGPGRLSVKEHTRQLEDLNARREELEKTLAQQIPEMNMEQRLRQVNMSAVADCLPDDAALIEFVRINIFDFKALPAQRQTQWKPPHYVAFVLHGKDTKRIRILDLGDAFETDLMIAALRRKITGEREDTDERHLKIIKAAGEYDAGKETPDNNVNLRKRIFDPLVKAFGDCKKLFLSPDGDLSRLPFEVLPADKHGYLIETYMISYLSVGRDLLRFQHEGTGHKTAALVVADPDFDLTDTQANSVTDADVPAGWHPNELRGTTIGLFQRLEGTRAEGKQIAKLLGVIPLLDRMALEGSIKACQSPTILHIASHGFFLPDQIIEPGHEPFGLGFASSSTPEAAQPNMLRLDNPLVRSGLALAGANTWRKGGTLPAKAEDGLLTAEDVTGLDLLETDLVVLSACGTGLGKVFIGEGVFGLRRAFIIAGAKTLIMSLWKVPDKQTQELMEIFYSFILQGQPPPDALRKAQLQMRNKMGGPYYWGAFICQGSTRPLF